MHREKEYKQIKEFLIKYTFIIFLYLLTDK